MAVIESRISGCLRDESVLQNKAYLRHIWGILGLRIGACFGVKWKKEGLRSRVWLGSRGSLVP